MQVVGAPTLFATHFAELTELEATTPGAIGRGLRGGGGLRGSRELCGAGGASVRVTGGARGGTRMMSAHLLCGTGVRAVAAVFLPRAAAPCCVPSNWGQAQV